MLAIDSVQRTVTEVLGRPSAAVEIDPESLSPAARAHLERDAQRLGLTPAQVLAERKSAHEAWIAEQLAAAESSSAADKIASEVRRL